MKLGETHTLLSGISVSTALGIASLTARFCGVSQNRLGGELPTSSCCRRGHEPGGCDGGQEGEGFMISLEVGRIMSKVSKIWVCRTLLHPQPSSSGRSLLAHLHSFVCGDAFRLLCCQGSSSTARHLTMRQGPSSKPRDH